MSKEAYLFCSKKNIFRLSEEKLKEAGNLFTGVTWAHSIKHQIVPFQMRWQSSAPIKATFQHSRHNNPPHQDHSEKRKIIQKLIDLLQRGKKKKITCICAQVSNWQVRSKFYPITGEERRGSATRINLMRSGYDCWGTGERHTLICAYGEHIRLAGRECPEWRGREGEQAGMDGER